MPQYIMLVNFTDQGLKDVKDVPSRQDKSRDLGAFQPLDRRPSGCLMRRHWGRLRAPPFRQSANPVR